MAEPDANGMVMLGNYPFYFNGVPPDEARAVYEEHKARVEEILGDNVKRISRMGSSAIDGIAGTPVVDILVEVNSKPLKVCEVKKMEAAGYEFRGTAPHNEDDEWFFGGDSKPGHLGRVVIHTALYGCSYAQTLNAFVAYVKVTPSAFERYNSIKIEGARAMMSKHPDENPLLGYKDIKSTVCAQLLEEAKEWAKEQQKLGTPLSK
eukprot:TRINITY_DN3849_c0_g1_i1.p1 TRINITY_DN3849_c0_g1~~TRINITY_DN3849_c0_g1_i1.p1  ORF type:complete len:221 (+),score=65.25 TRINITY_DN3849_c0_g1_i1:46-663(+)